nr:PREDICTED: uncharacterized protein LOC109036407 [Bemisia tabaci]
MFPECLILCCTFHLAQNWFKHIQQNKFLLREYNTPDSEVGKYLKYFFGLPYLPPTEIEAGFVDLLSIAPPQVPSDFSDYVLETYIDEAALFPPSMWAGPPSDGPRTTNGPESFHSNYNKNFYHRPSIHSVTQVLLETQALTMTKINSIKKQSTNVIRKETADRLATSIQAWNTCKEALEGGSETARLRYLKFMGYRFHGKKV